MRARGAARSVDRNHGAVAVPMRAATVVRRQPRLPTIANMAPCGSRHWATHMLPGDPPIQPFGGRPPWKVHAERSRSAKPGIVLKVGLTLGRLACAFRAVEEKLHDVHRARCADDRPDKTPDPAGSSDPAAASPASHPGRPRLRRGSVLPAPSWSRTGHIPSRTRWMRRPRGWNETWTTGAGTGSDDGPWSMKAR